MLKSEQQKVNLNIRKSNVNGKLLSFMFLRATCVWEKSPLHDGRKYEQTKAAGQSCIYYRQFIEKWSQDFWTSVDLSILLYYLHLDSEFCLHFCVLSIQ